MKRLHLILLVLSALVFLGIFDSLYVVNYDKQGILLQLGEVIGKEPIAPGLGIKKPLIQKIVLVDRRILDLPSDVREVIAADQKRVIVNYYTKYRIVDPIMFYRTTRQEAILESRLKAIVESQMREQIGKVPLLGLLNEDRNAVMEKIRAGADAQSRESLGVSTVDVRIKRTDLPEENSEAVFRRMQTEREKEAKEIRAKGFELAQKIKASADKEESVILADAHRKAKILVGEGDAESARVLNEAFGVDKDFFEFYKTLELYRHSLGGEKTRFVFSTKDELLKLFGGGK